MSIVAHLYLAEAKALAYNPDQLEVTLRVVGNEANKSWAASTPTGELKLAIRNPDALGIFRDPDSVTGWAVKAEYEVTIRKLPANEAGRG
jgi:hypothetical protein